MTRLLAIGLCLISIKAFAVDCGERGEDGKCYLFAERVAVPINHTRPAIRKDGRPLLNDRYDITNECQTAQLEIKTRAEKWAAVNCINGKEALMLGEKEGCSQVTVLGFGRKPTVHTAALYKRVGCKEGVNQFGACAMAAQNLYENYKSVCQLGDKKYELGENEEACPSSESVLNHCQKNGGLKTYQPGDSIHKKQERTFNDAPTKATGP